MLWLRISGDEKNVSICKRDSLKKTKITEF